MKFEKVCKGKNDTIVIGERIIVPGNVLLIQWEDGDKTLTQVIKSSDEGQEIYAVGRESIWFEIKDLVTGQKLAIIKNGMLSSAFIAQSVEGMITTTFAQPRFDDHRLWLGKCELKNLTPVLIFWPDRFISWHKLRCDTDGQTQRYWVEVNHHGIPTKVTIKDSEAKLLLLPKLE